MTQATNNSPNVVMADASGQRRGGLLGTARGWVAPMAHRFIYRNWLAGKWVEITGNKVSYQGLTFDVSDPCIDPTIKARFLFHVYEKPEAVSLKKHLDRSLPAVEIGACLGVVSCFTNTLLEHPGKHVIVEANPRLIPIIEKNRERNGCKFTTINAALAYGTEEVEFFLNKWVIASSLDQDLHKDTRTNKVVEKVRVPSISVAKILDDHGFERATLIVDIEGAELQLVNEEIDVLRDRVHQLFIETHGRLVGDDKIDAMVRKLEGVGFRILNSIKTQIVMQRE